MALRINHNIAALNAHRQLQATESALAKSLEKLSSGYRINKAGDDPAGLVISERLRAQITGLSAALRNTQDAISMIQTAEGALSEMHALLNSMRGLALHAANEGANDADTIAADQAQIDSAIESLDRIANTTKYAGKYLLNGEAGAVVATIVDTTNVSSVVLGTDTDGNSTIPDAAVASGYLVYGITAAATQAAVTDTQLDFDSGGQTLTGAGITINTGGSLVVNGVEILSDSDISGGWTASGILAAINSGLAADARTANLSASFNTGYQIVISETRYGDAYGVHVEDTLFGAGSLDSTDAGSDISGWIGTSGNTATGDGLTMTISGAAGTPYLGTSITFTEAGNVVGTSSDDITLSEGTLVFQLGAFANTNEQARISIADMRTTNLGISATQSIYHLYSGRTYALASDPSTAVQIIDAAIDDVSSVRSDLGAFQRNTLETNLNSLAIAKENLTDSESRLRDVDMAEEMATFTRHQILLQAGIAMLAQANLAPQAVLRLLS